MRMFLASFAAILCMSAVSEVPASVLPPHTDVVTHCGVVTAVFVTSGKEQHRAELNLNNTKPAVLEDMAYRTPRAAWIEAGCSAGM